MGTRLRGTRDMAVVDFVPDTNKAEAEEAEITKQHPTAIMMMISVFIYIHC